MKIIVVLNTSADHFLKVAGSFKSPAGLGAGRAHIRRDDALPAHRVGFRSHDVRLVHHVLAHARAPIGLRRRAHGAEGYGTDLVFRLVLLDVFVERKLGAAYRSLFVESIGGARQADTARLCWSA